MAVLTGGAAAPGDGLAALDAVLRDGRSLVGPLAPDAIPDLAQPRLGVAIGDPALEARIAALPAALRGRAARAARGASRTVAASLAPALAAMPADGAAAWPEPERFAIVLAGSNLMLGDAWRAAETFRTEPAWLSPRHGYRFFDTHIAALACEMLDARGPGLSVGGASASGNVAIATGFDLVAHGRADACLVIGPVFDLSPMEWHALGAMGALAGPDTQACRPFDRAADGFVPGEAAAALLLEDAASAARRGAAPLAEIAGACCVMGASHLPAPDADGAFRAMAGALADGGVGVDALDCVSAHATATPGGDAAECAALRRLLGDRPVAVTATKSITGHALQAAGVVELVALIVQMRGAYVHPIAGLERPIATDLDLVRGAARARRIGYALSNSFGFGGIGTSVLVRHAERA